MTRNKTYALILTVALVLCAAGLAISAPAAGAQGAPSAVPDSQKIIKTRFEVLHMLYQSIQVRSLADMKELHTFTYSPEIRDQMQNIFNAGGYQYGDQVVVWYHRGGSVALKIKGKPSKPN
jgi:hypothetical protein